MKLPYQLLGSMAVLLIAANAVAAGTGPGGGSLSLGRDRYSTGGSVLLDGLYDGDLVGAAGEAYISGRILGDVLFGAGTIEIDSDIGDDLRLAGGSLTLNQTTVAGTASLAGGMIEISRDSTVREGLLAVGGNIDIEGTVQGGVYAAGGSVTIRGQLQGPVKIISDHVALRSGARIDGDLEYQSPQALVRDPDVVVTGAIRHTPLQTPSPSPGSGAAFSIVVSLGLAMVLLLFGRKFPQVLAEVTESLDSRPWECFGVGVLSLAGIPIVALVLLVTVIGAPLSMLSMALWGIALLLSRVLVSAYLGRRLAERMRGTPSATQAMGWAVGTVVLIGLLYQIPLVGWLARFAVFAFGTGALLLAIWQRRVRRPTGSDPDPIRHIATGRDAAPLPVQ